MSTAPALSQALDSAIRDSDGAFVVDLCDVEFLDSSGVSALLRARALLGQDERHLLIVCPDRAARRIFAVAGITDLLVLFDSREQAGAALRPTG